MFSFCEIIIDSLWTFPHFCDIVCTTTKRRQYKWRYTLEEHGVYFLSHRSNGERILEVRFVPQFSDASAVSDAENGSAKSCDPCVPCVTDGSVVR